jgi:hypothetical protein
MDLTGAHWGLHGAAAILKLRALRCNGDFETYWRLCGAPHKRHYGTLRIMRSSRLRGPFPLVTAAAWFGRVNIIRVG